MNIRSKDVVDDAWESEFQVSAYFGAEIFAVLGPSSVSKGIEWAFPKPDEFWKTNDGADISYTNDFHKFMHKDGFRVIMIDYDQLPQGVREWREMEMREGNSKERKWIAVVDGKAFFSPGVVKFLQPLFATKDVELGENTCKDELTNLNNFRSKHPHNEDERYITDFRGISEVGTTLRLQAFAEKQVYRPNEKKQTNHNDEL